MPDIVIVGAGMAGLAAAETLQEQGFTPRLLDKARRPGGRCATRRVAAPDDAEWFDYGAQYFTARSPAFRDWLAPDRDRGRVIAWRPTIAVAERLGPTWLLTPSPDDRERLVGARGLNPWLRARLADRDMAVATERRVQHVTRANDRRWRITCADGETDTADALLLTPPAVQTAAILGDRAGRIAPLRQAGGTLAACHSVIVRAPALADAQAIFFKSGRLAWAADNTHKAGGRADPALWTLHADAEFSQAHVETPAAELADTLVEEFATATGQSRAAMEIVHAHRWRYARPGPEAPDPERLCWVEPEARLAVAGDWLAGGRIEGAWHSGRAAAERLARALTG